jgi:uncharacterized Ntn-hydrolase superfamily protein
MTFSIVAHDPTTGALGIAVASKAPAVGTVVPYLHPGVGAIATQSCGDFAHGPRAIGLLEAGTRPEDVIASLVTQDDPLFVYRQLGVVDARGRGATFTGPDCKPWAGGTSGPHYACQGNRLAGSVVVDAMATAFEATPGDLDIRLLAALVAGDREGGDRLGRQSAALLVVRADSPWGFDGRYADVRVDDHPDAVTELARIHNVWRRAVRLPPSGIT